MKKVLNKITSRKFIVTAVIIISGLAAAFKSSHNEKVQIIGCVMAAMAGIAYMVIEGTIDKTSVGDAATKAINGIQTIESEKSK